MSYIALEGMEFHAYHGTHPEEQVFGNNFVLDVYLYTDVSNAMVYKDGGEEKIIGTINYETLYDVCRFEMQKREPLIESVVFNIIDALKKQFHVLQGVKIRLKKKYPPVGGLVAASVIEEEEYFARECARCKRPMICYGRNTNNFNADCGCMELREKIHPRTFEMLSLQHKGCLCNRCLKEFVG